jgi:hypothetical protein
MSKAFAALLARRFAPLDFSSVPGFPHPVPNMSEWGDFLPIFKESKEDNPAEHLLKFHECMDLLDLPHEDVRMKMFMFSLYGDARQWYFSLPPSSISSLKDFHKAFTKHCKRYFSDEFAFDNCCDEYELHCKLEDVNLERASPHNMPQPVNDLQDIVFSHQNELQMDYKETERSLSILKSDCYELEEMVSLATQRDDQRCLHKDQIASFQNSEYVEQADISVEDSLKPAIDSKDSFQSFDCSTHDEKEDDEQKGSGQKWSSYFSLTKIKQFTFSICEEKKEQHYSQLDQQLKEVFHSDFYDPITNFLESMSNINIKTFLSDEGQSCFCYRLYFCMIWLPSFFGLRSRSISGNHFLTWLHWKHDFT